MLFQISHSVRTASSESASTCSGLQSSMSSSQARSRKLLCWPARIIHSEIPSEIQAGFDSVDHSRKLHCDWFFLLVHNETNSSLSTTTAVRTSSFLSLPWLTLLQLLCLLHGKAERLGLLTCTPVSLFWSHILTAPPRLSHNQTNYQPALYSFQIIACLYCKFTQSHNHHFWQQLSLVLVNKNKLLSQFRLSSPIVIT